MGGYFAFDVGTKKKRRPCVFFVLFCNLREFFSTPPIPKSMRNPALCMNGTCFTWSNSLRTVGAQQWGVGGKQCPLWQRALLGHSAHELVSAGGFHRRQEITVPDPNLYQ